MTDDLHLLLRKLPMTREGYIALQRDLAHRAQVDRPRIAEPIRDAIADDPNLPENADYQAGKTEQEVNEAAIAELQNKLARADVINVSEPFGRYCQIRRNSNHCRRGHP
jgi:transcription elongation factor GreA